MTDCPFQPRLDAYHDGELSAEERRPLEEHLHGCAACAAELAEMHELSSRILAATEPAFIAPDESRRLHDAVTHAADDADEQPNLPLFRTAGLLGALAASVLIVCGVWLIDLRGTGNVTIVRAPQEILAPADWEVVATRGYADPRPGLIDDSPLNDSALSPRYAAAVQWMLSGLSFVPDTN